jgi:excisionase family DNA binding protein
MAIRPKQMAAWLGEYWGMKPKKKKRPAQPADRLTPPQVAKRYGVSPDTVRSWIERGELRAVNIGNGTVKPRYRIEPAALADFDKRRTADKTPPQKRPKKKPTGLTVTKFSDRR